jgi:hypothetical protein
MFKISSHSIVRNVKYESSANNIFVIGKLYVLINPMKKADFNQTSNCCYVSVEYTLAHC